MGNIAQISFTFHAPLSYTSDFPVKELLINKLPVNNEKLQFIILAVVKKSNIQYWVTLK
jgi:hypothetical protein